MLRWTEERCLERKFDMRTFWGIMLVGLMLASTPGCANKQKAYEETQKGEVALEEGRYDEAIADFTAAIKANGKDPLAYLHRANAYRAKGGEESLRLALADYNAVLTRDPNNWRAYFDRGEALVDLGRYSEAVNDFSEVIELQPNRPDGYLGRAQAYRQHIDQLTALASADEKTGEQHRLGSKTPEEAAAQSPDPAK